MQFNNNKILFLSDEKKCDLFKRYAKCLCCFIIKLLRSLLKMPRWKNYNSYSDY